ncbi:MAG: hypothetical protein ABIL09_21910 [Gemmatimonadota bacterium]
MTASRRGDLTPVPPEGLRRFFRSMVRPTFAALGLGQGEVADYVTDLLARFARTDQLYRVRDARGRRLETIADLLVELMRAWDSPAPYRYDREVDIRRHCGDYALFMSGLFRAHVEGGALLGYYLAEGERAYRTVAERLSLALSGEAVVYRALAAEFEQLSGALDYMRKVYMQPQLQAGPYGEALRRLGLN